MSGKYNEFKEQIENMLGSKVTNSELNKAVEATKDDVFTNEILFGHEVSAGHFAKKVCETIVCMRRAVA